MSDPSSQHPHQSPQPQPHQPPHQQPYPPMPFPPMFMPPPQPPQKRGSAWPWLIAAFLIIGVICVGFVLLIGLLFSGDEPGSTVAKTVSAGGTGTVAVIPVTGVIMDPAQKQFREDLDRARTNPNLKAVVIEISSPGGTVTDSNQMYHDLMNFKANTGLPIFIHMDDLAASGGYFLACAGDEIYCEETTLTGSIGVLLSYPELSGFAEKTGIRYKTVIASGSPRKNFLDTWEAPSEEDLEVARDLLDDQYDLFTRVVMNARSQQIAAAGSTIEEVASGAVFIGPDAQKLGLVDGLGFIDDTVALAAKKAGLTNPTVIRYERVPTLFDVLGMASSPDGLQGKVQSEQAKSLVTELLHEATTPRSFYLYRGVQ